VAYEPNAIGTVVSISNGSLLLLLLLVVLLLTVLLLDSNDVLDESADLVVVVAVSILPKLLLLLLSNELNASNKSGTLDEQLRCLMLLLLPVIIRSDNEEGDGLFIEILGVPNCNNCFELELGIAASVVVNNEEDDNDSSIIAADKGDN
jgi:hypothetical protein